MGTQINDIGVLQNILNKIWRYEDHIHTTQHPTTSISFSKIITLTGRYAQIDQWRHLWRTGKDVHVHACMEERKMNVVFRKNLLHYKIFYYILHIFYIIYVIFRFLIVLEKRLQSFSTFSEVDFEL